MQNLTTTIPANGIDVPRLRGYRLMKDEERLTNEEIEKMRINDSGDDKWKRITV